MGEIAYSVFLRGGNMATTRRQTAASKSRVAAKTRVKPTQKAASTSRRAKTVSQNRTNKTNKKSSSAKRRRNKKETRALVAVAIEKHFQKLSMSEIVTAKRKFPPTARADLQQALDDTFDNDPSIKQIGFYQDYSYGSGDFTSLLDTNRNPTFVGPLQFDEIDTGEKYPSRCLKNCLWLGVKDNTPFAVVLANSDRRYEQDGTMLEIAVPAGYEGVKLSQEILHELEQLVSRSLSYRGKVISLEQSSRYSGESGTIRVHKLHAVDREQVILPPKTLQLLERNVMDFIGQRQRLNGLGMPLKKGLLFYGPPGTGKTHTIHYLASRLPDHTTLLITAGQVGLLEEYFLLARFMQPAMIVIEDADLIARDRERMQGGCEETLLNRLLNEMDGLRSDAAILFILTTNRPEHLEVALASRPGRIDQAIEFPLPDAEGRQKLLKLYSGGLTLGAEITESIVQRTHGASAAFIKELMRRAAQYYLQNNGIDTNGFSYGDLNMALEDMLFSGGKLNVRLLGGELAANANEVPVR